MKFLLLLIAISVASFSQSFELSSFDSNKSADFDSSGEDWKFAAITAYADVTNISGEAVSTNLVVKFRQNAGHVFSICDNENCYTGITEDWSTFEESGKFMLWPSGANDDTFIVDGLNFKMSPIESSPFLPENQDKGAKDLVNTGTTIIEVTLQNASSSDDFISFEMIFEVAVDGVTSVEVREIENNLNVFPNPASDNLNLSYSGDMIHLLNDSQIKIYDMEGTLLMSEEFSNSKTLDISKLASGKYIQKITLSDGNIATKSFVKI